MYTNFQIIFPFLWLCPFPYYISIWFFLMHTKWYHVPAFRRISWLKNGPEKTASYYSYFSFFSYFFFLSICLYASLSFLSFFFYLSFQSIPEVFYCCAWRNIPVDGLTRRKWIRERRGPFWQTRSNPFGSLPRCSEFRQKFDHLGWQCSDLVFHFILGFVLLMEGLDFGNLDSIS